MLETAEGTDGLLVELTASTLVLEVWSVVPGMVVGAVFCGIISLLLEVGATEVEMETEVTVGSLDLEALVGSGTVANGGLEFDVTADEGDASTAGNAVGICDGLAAVDALVIGDGLESGDGLGADGGLGSGEGPGVGDGFAAGRGVEVASNAAGGVVLAIAGGVDSG